MLAGLLLGSTIFTTAGYTVLYVKESVGTSVVFGGVVLTTLQATGSVARVVMGWLGDVLPGDPQRRIGGILFVQAVAGAVLFVVTSMTTTALSAAVAFGALGFFILGLTGVFYSCMATLVSADEIGEATAGGQLALTTGCLIAPPIFGYLADVASYRVSWWFLAINCVVAAVLIGRVVQFESPVSNPVMRE